MTILSPSDLADMHLPIDLSGYAPEDLFSMLRQAEAWVNGEARHAHGFEAHRVIDRVYGTGENKLRTTYYPVCTLNSVQIIFPPNTGNVNQPGPNMVPIDPSRVVIDHEAGFLYNWAPFVFQTIGYMTVFPSGVPINIDYYTGYVGTTTTSSLSVGATLLPVTNASCFYYGQSIRFYEPAQQEFVTVLGTTTQGNVQLVVSQDPLQYQHASGVSVGDIPFELRQAVAYVVCDFALRELNPEDLLSLDVDKIKKSYKPGTRPVADQGNGNSFIFEEERPFIKEARRLLEHLYSDRGIL